MASSKKVFPMSPEDNDVLNGLSAEHPRLIFTSERLKNALALVDSDYFMKSVIDDTITVSDAMLSDPPVEHIVDGRRLLAQSRKALSHILHTAAAFLLTGKNEYAASCKTEMLAAAAMSDWNPSHFLDVAEMSAALAFGYDWIFDTLSEAERQTIRQALIEKGLKAALSSDSRWVNSVTNWNQVCNTGMTLAALTVAEYEPELARANIERAINGVPHAMKPYLPDGAYPEGPMYWGYGTSYNCILIDALQSALGHDFGLSENTGFRDSIAYRLMMVAPDNRFYLYSDSKDHETPGEAMMWFTSHFGQDHITGLCDNIKAELAHITAKYAGDITKRKSWRFWPLLLSWYSPPQSESQTTLPLNRVFHSEMPVGVFKSDDSPNALWLGFKGGDIDAGHSQMDHGSFSLVAGGKRWIHDLGADNYTKLEIIGGLWQRPSRHQFFRYATWGHSMLRLGDNNLQEDHNRAEIVNFHESTGQVSAIVELGAAWSDHAADVKRGYAMVKGKSVLVQDEVTDPKAEIIWQVIVPDKVEINDSRATLTDGDDRFVLEILEPKGAKFELTDALPQHELENQNEGYARLYFKLPAKAGKTTLAVQMWLDNGQRPEPAGITPLSQWPE